MQLRWLLYNMATQLVSAKVQLQNLKFAEVRYKSHEIIYANSCECNHGARYMYVM